MGFIHYNINPPLHRKIESLLCKQTDIVNIEYHNQSIPMSFSTVHHLTIGVQAPDLYHKSSGSRFFFELLKAG